MAEGGAVTVIVRVRPLLSAEQAHGDVCRSSGNTLVLDEPESPHMRELLRESGSSLLGAQQPLASYTFNFDHVFGTGSSQAEVYERTAQPAVSAVLEGFNATVIAYGMTGAGKTFTMEGATGEREQRGVTPRAFESIFEHIRTCTDPSKRFLVRASYLQIYNESISDLLRTDRTGLAVREDRRRGLHVEGLSEWVVRSVAEVGRLLARGQSARATGSTRLNELSSRSHAVVLVVVEQASVPPEGSGTAGRRVRVGKLNLVDLAGSERLSGESSGTRLQESKKINTSLSALGNVVAALSERSAGRSRAHIPYRDSKLTRLLEDSLGGNCKTTMIALVSPAAHAFPESLSTLKFATRANTVRNSPTVNVGDEVTQGALLRAYEVQLAQLRAELAQRSITFGDSARLLELEQLHARHELEREKASIEEDKLQVVRYKALLVKQRDLMLALTSRLTDRDASLVQVISF
ncbi:P-loop containing nucleoside triphosphate hydrolase protein [Pavlovales sp. CCMP2436]|nr:P-loop containing nucleoside triphosphate hydrolase protein [Pavlovales sp. CCMP2436]